MYVADFEFHVARVALQERRTRSSRRQHIRSRRELRDLVIALVPFAFAFSRLPSADPFRPQEQFFFHFHLPRTALASILVRRLDEFPEERLRVERLRFELRMELAAQEIRMVPDFYDLDVSSIWSRTRDPKSRAGKQRLVFAIELIAMAMAFANFRLLIRASRQ